MYASLMCMDVSVLCLPTFMSMHDGCEHTRARTHARAHSEITHTPLSCGGEECDADSLSLLIQSYKNTHMCMYIHVFCFLFVCFSADAFCGLCKLECVSVCV
jgi:hypothetical protein